MILRLLLPAADHPVADTPVAWALADARGQPLRDGVAPLGQVPRATTVEAVLPVSRVLFARLKLPKVGATKQPRSNRAGLSDPPHNSWAPSFPARSIIPRT